MQIQNLAAGITDWNRVPLQHEPGQSGTASARTREFGGIKLRLVDYSPGYQADHWCDKGHIVHVIEGSLVIAHRDGRRFTLTPGLTYHVPIRKIRIAFLAPAEREFL